MKKNTWVFLFHKYGKFWSVSLDKKVDLKPLFSEECIVIYSKKVYRPPTILRWPSYVLRKCRETRRRRNRTSQKSVSLRSAPRVHTRYPIFLWEEVLGIVTTTTSARTKEYRLGTNAWCINVCIGMWVLYIFMKYIVHTAKITQANT